MTVQQLIEKLQSFPQDYEVVIYPKYKHGQFKKYYFREDQVCLQEPYATTIKDAEALKAYLGDVYEKYEYTNHIAILY